MVANLGQGDESVGGGAASCGEVAGKCCGVMQTKQRIWSCLSAFLSPSSTTGILHMATTMPALQDNLFALCSRRE